MKRFKRPIPIGQKLTTALLRLVFITLAIFGLSIWVLFSGPALDRIALARVGEISAQTGASVAGAYRNAENLLWIAANWLSKEDLALDHQNLNRRFIPLLAQYPDLVGLRIADGSGNEWLLNRNPDGTWLNRLVSAADKSQPTRRFLRWKDGEILAGDERRDSRYIPQDQPWFQKATQAGPGKLVATEIGRLEDRGDLGAMLALALPDSRARHGVVVGVELSLKEVTSQLSALRLGDRGLALLFTDAGQILGHSRAERFGLTYQPGELMLASVVGLDLGPLQDGIGRWLGRDELPLEDALFVHNFDLWSGSYRSLPWGDTKLWMGVYLPLSEMLTWLPYRLIAFGLVVVLVFAIGKLVAIALARSIVQPLNQIGENVRRISRWDFALSEHIHSSMEEIERLAAAQERMRANLRRAWKFLPPKPASAVARLENGSQPPILDPISEPGGGELDPDPTRTP